MQLSKTGMQRLRKGIWDPKAGIGNFLYSRRSSVYLAEVELQNLPSHFEKYASERLRYYVNLSMLIMKFSEASGLADAL